jgi:hypothetical protein
MGRTDEKESLGGELTDLPNPKYAEFFARFAEIDTLPIEQYKPVHLIGYFTRKYKRQYNADYQFKYNSPKPNSAFEVFQIKKLAQLLSASPSILVGYIDWIFTTKVPALKRRFTSISLLTKEEFIKEYKLGVLLVGQTQLNVNRSTPLPPEYQKIILEGNGTKLKTYGDLAFTHQAREANAFPKVFNETWDACLQKLETLGFNPTVLKRIT